MNKYFEIIDNAITRVNEEPTGGLKKLTTQASWDIHGKRSEGGSWIEGIDEEEFYLMLPRLAWTPAVDQGNLLILKADLPQSVKGYQAATAIDKVSNTDKVKIDLSHKGHPAAILLNPPLPIAANVLTLIIEKDGSLDKDVSQYGSGPLIATWFPGETTPQTDFDGLLKHGDIVTVEEAKKHGFGTVKF